MNYDSSNDGKSILLADYGWVGDIPEGPGRLGRIVRVDRGECDLVTAEGSIRAVSDSRRSQDQTAPVTGDWVLVLQDPEMGYFINQVLPRTSVLSRRDPAEESIEQVLVSNVDLVIIVHGLDRPLPPGRLERYLVLAWNSGAEVAVVLTKANRNLSVTNEVTELVRVIAPEVKLLTIDIPDNPESLCAVECLFKVGMTAALLGESGAGKSSLVNALVGSEVMETGKVRTGDRKGRHTTVSRELVHRPAGGLLVDMPGLRAIGLWDAQEALERVFGDLEKLSESCRFSDCAHGVEPDCAVQAAVREGQMEEQRIVRYQALRKELDDQKAREASRKQAGGNRRR